MKCVFLLTKPNPGEITKTEEFAHAIGALTKLASLKEKRAEGGP